MRSEKTRKIRQTYEELDTKSDAREIFDSFRGGPEGAGVFQGRRCPSEAPSATGWSPCLVLAEIARDTQQCLKSIERLLRLLQTPSQWAGGRDSIGVAALARAFRSRLRAFS